MMPQLDYPWIDLNASPNNLFIDEYYHSYNAFHQLHFPDEQDPQMIMFIGNEAKTKAIRRLEPSLNNQDNHRKIHLQLVPHNINTRSPILIADCELHNALLSEKKPSSFNGVEHHALNWHQKVPIQELDTKILAHLVYSKLISPFSTIICLFADDLGGTRAVADILASWLISLSNRSSDLPISTYPRVLILKSDNGVTFNEERETLKFMKELAEETKARNGNLVLNSQGQFAEDRFNALLKQQFGGLRVLTLPNFLGPEEELQYQKQENAEWQLLKTRILQGSQRIQDRRRKAQVAFSATHFRAFFHLACIQFAEDIVTPFSFVKASRLANPMPQNFSYHIASFLTSVKQVLLEPFAIPFIASAMTLDSCPPGMHIFPPAQVFQQFYTEVLNYIQIDKEKIQNLFCQQVLENINELSAPAKTHKAVLSQFRNHWQSIYNNSTCLSCIARPPENILDCKHTFCDFCIIIYGHTVPEEPWNFILDTCPLCGTSNKTKFLLKPYTAGIRALGINGLPGDAFAANFLRELEARLPLRKMKIREHFDVALGAGSGALIIPGLFCAGLSFDECITLSRDSTSGRSLLQPFANRSKQYSTTRINSVFKKALGQNTFFEYSGSGTKVAVVATSIKDSSMQIFSNYNGPTPRLDASDYSLIRPENSKDEILLWEASRAASAAPPHLKSFSGYRDLEDQSNLTDLILWEQNFIWSRRNKSPDIFLLLGEKTEMTTMAGKASWLEGKPLEAWMSFVSDSIVASLFYIELAGLPLLSELGFICQVNVQCRLLPSEPHLKTLVKQLWDRQACFFYGFGTSVPCVDQELLENIKYGAAYSRLIKINIRSLNDLIDMKIDGVTKRARSISNCPYMVNDIIEDQGLHCFFGRKDHQRKCREIPRTV